MGYEGGKGRKSDERRKRWHLKKYSLCVSSNCHFFLATMILTVSVLNTHFILKGAFTDTDTNTR